MNIFKRLFGMLALLLLSSLAGASGTVPELRPIPESQPGLWRTVLAVGQGSAYAGSAGEACRLQHASINPTAILQGHVYYSEHSMLCVWERSNPGNGLMPTTVQFHCPQGYVRQNFRCIPHHALRPPCNTDCGATMKSGTPQPNIGNPININTGMKVLAETDYATADGLFRVDRNYLSGGFRGWDLLLPGYLEMTGNFNHVVIFHSRGGGQDQFFAADLSNQNNWVWRVPAVGNRARGTSRRTLTMITVPTTTRKVFSEDPNVLPAGPGEMRLDMANGEYILFRRANGIPPADGGRRLVPVEHRRPGGHVTWYDYNDTSYFPYRVRDSLNRQLTLSWVDAPWNRPGIGIAASKVISRIDLPDATRLEYDYDHSAVIYQSAVPQWAQQLGYNVPTDMTGRITVEIGGRLDRLRSVSRRTADGTLLWQRQFDYQYNLNPHAMTAVRDQTGAVLAEYTYGSTGLLLTSRLAGNVNPHQFQHFEVYYNNVLSNETVRRVISPSGRVEDYWLRRASGTELSEASTLMRIDGWATPTTPADVQSFVYDSSSSRNNLMTRFVDQLGRQTAYVPDIPTGRPTSVTEAFATPLARQTTLQWHPTWDLPTRIERHGQRIDIAYTADAKVASQTITDLTAHTVPYSTNGQTRTVSYSWGANARLLAINGPRPVDGQGRDDTITFAYDAAGNVTAMTNGMGHVTSFGAYDSNGQPGTMTDPDGVVTQFTYDALGRVTTIRAKHPTDGSLDAVTGVTYDEEGRVETVMAPASAPLAMTYDLAGQLKAVVAANGERIDYAHDAMGNVVSQTVRRANGTTASSISATFDALGRTLTETLGPGRTWTFAYDKVGNPTGVTSPRNQSTANSFDALDRLVSSALPDGGAPSVTFDQRDGVTENRDPIGVTTRFVRNGFGEPIQEVSPDRGTSIYHYNSAGDRIAVIDGRGQRIDYAFDILGRRLSAIPQGRPGSEAVSYVWDIDTISGSYTTGRLARVVDGATSIEYGFDHRGNVTTKRQQISGGAWATLLFDYDLADRTSQITYPSGRIVQYDHDTLGRVVQVRTRASASETGWTILASGMTYEAFGALLEANYGNGLGMVQSWGNDGRLAHRRLETATGQALSSLTYGYDAADNIISLTDLIAASRSRGFAYDPMDRMTQVTGDLGGFAQEDYIHDANGNRLRVERRAAIGAVNASQTETYTTAPGTNRLTAIASLTGSRSFTHDARGNQTGETWPNGTSVSVAYDGRGRLTAYTSGAASQTMLYNGADERVTVVTTPASGPVDTRIYVYDLDHRIVGEYGPGGNADIKAEYIWTLPEVRASGPTGGDDGTGGYMPLAVAVGTGGTLNWVHGDHMGVPHVTTDATGAPVTPTGYALSGFPGQFANAVLLPGAAHYYNRYRDYDPTTGRYIQADPIGLEGDENPYAYALGNPLRYTDPTGEFVPMLFGIAVGAGFEALTNRCASRSDIIMAGALGGIGGGIGKLALLRHGHRALTREMGKEWSHWYPKRFADNAWTPIRLFLNRRGGLNGSWVTPQRHFKHDPYRYPKGSKLMGQKWHPLAQQADRIPDWLKVSTGSGIGGSIVSESGRCGCK